MPHPCNAASGPIPSPQPGDARIQSPTAVSPPRPVSSSGVDYLTPTPSMIEVYRTSNDRVMNWSNAVPPRRANSARSAAGSAVWSDDPSQSLDTVPEHPGQPVRVGSDARSLRRRSDQGLRVPGSTYSPAGSPMRAPTRSSSREGLRSVMAPSQARSPPMAALAQSPTAAAAAYAYAAHPEAFGSHPELDGQRADSIMSRANHLVSQPYPQAPPSSFTAPMAPIRSEREAREAYFASALEFPLDLLSEVQTPPEAETSSTKGGRMTSLLSRARSTVSLRGHETKAEVKPVVKPDRQENNGPATPMAVRSASVSRQAMRPPPPPSYPNQQHAGHPQITRRSSATFHSEIERERTSVLGSSAPTAGATFELSHAPIAPSGHPYAYSSDQNKLRAAAPQRPPRSPRSPPIPLLSQAAGASTSPGQAADAVSTAPTAPAVAMGQGRHSMFGTASAPAMLKPEGPTTTPSQNNEAIVHAPDAQHGPTASSELALQGPEAGATLLRTLSRRTSSRQAIVQGMQMDSSRQAVRPLGPPSGPRPAPFHAPPGAPAALRGPTPEVEERLATPPQSPHRETDPIVDSTLSRTPSRPPSLPPGSVDQAPIVGATGATTENHHPPQQPRPIVIPPRTASRTGQNINNLIPPLSAHTARTTHTSPTSPISHTSGSSYSSHGPRASDSSSMLPPDLLPTERRARNPSSVASDDSAVDRLPPDQAMASPTATDVTDTDQISFDVPPSRKRLHVSLAWVPRRRSLRDRPPSRAPSRPTSGATDPRQAATPPPAHMQDTKAFNTPASRPTSLYAPQPVQPPVPGMYPRPLMHQPTGPYMPAMGSMEQPLHPTHTGTRTQQPAYPSQQPTQPGTQTQQPVYPPGAGLPSPPASYPHLAPVHPQASARTPYPAAGQPLPEAAYPSAQHPPQAPYAASRAPQQAGYAASQVPGQAARQAPHTVPQAGYAASQAPMPLGGYGQHALAGAQLPYPSNRHPPMNYEGAAQGPSQPLNARTLRRHDSLSDPSGPQGKGWLKRWGFGKGDVDAVLSRPPVGHGANTLPGHNGGSRLFKSGPSGTTAEPPHLGYSSQSDRSKSGASDRAKGWDSDKEERRQRRRERRDERERRSATPNAGTAEAYMRTSSGVACANAKVEPSSNSKGRGGNSNANGRSGANGTASAKSNVNGNGKTKGNANGRAGGGGGGGLSSGKPKLASKTKDGSGSKSQKGKGRGA